jgi:hypothetical protein
MYNVKKSSNKNNKVSNLKNMLNEIVDCIFKIKISKRFLAIMLLIAFILSLIPVLFISKYNHPSADDFNYGILTVHTWRKTHSFYQTLLAAFKQVQITYKSWQGTFTAVFLFAIQPAVFSDKLYFISTIVLLFSFIFSTAFLVKVILIDAIKMDKATTLIIILSILIASIQFVPIPSQAFYWYNGSIYYTFYYSLLLILIGLILKLYITNKKKSCILYTVLIFLIAFFISGGNYTTALVSSIILFLFVIYSYITKSSKKYIILTTLFISLIGLYISAIAPGNAVRAAGIKTSLSPVSAIVHSAIEATCLIGAWTTLPILAIIAFLTPFIVHCVKKTKYSFNYPLAVLFLTLCVFSSQLTPPLYAMGDIGAGRQIDIYYYTYLWLVIINVFYCVGWCYRRYKQLLESYPIVDNKIQTSVYNKTKCYSVVLLIIIVYLFSAGCHQYGIQKIVSVNATIALKNKSAAQYDKEMQDRLKIYNDPNIINAKVQSLSVIPYLFDDDSDITTDPKYWTNGSMSSYYDKNSIVLISNDK